MKSSADVKKDFAKLHFDLLPYGFVKGYMDSNTNTSYISLDDGNYTYHSNSYNQEAVRFNNYEYVYNSLEELEQALINAEILDDDSYELTEEQYIMYSNLRHLKEQI